MYVVDRGEIHCRKVLRHLCREANTQSVTTINFSVWQGNCNEINSSRQLHCDDGVVITTTGYSRTAVRYRVKRDDSNQLIRG